MSSKIAYYKVAYEGKEPAIERIGRHGYYSRVIDDSRPNLHTFEDGGTATVTWDNDHAMYVTGKELSYKHLDEIVNKYKYYYES